MYSVDISTAPTLYTTTEDNTVRPVHNQHPMRCQTQLAGLKLPIHAHLFQRTILNREVGKTDLSDIATGVQREISWTAYARLQVSVCSG